MMFKRMWALFVARNREFIRDRAGFGWNIAFPFLLVAGFGIIFSSDTRSAYKIGVFPAASEAAITETTALPVPLLKDTDVRLVAFASREKAMDRLKHHKVDLVIEIPEQASDSMVRYWTSDSAKSGIAEKLLKAAVVPSSYFSSRLEKQQVDGQAIRYIDWLFPGIIGMNIMFSALFGVGYVIVRYRRSGVLKRLKATPVTAFEYLAAQMISRVAILYFSSALVWFGCDLLFSFNMHGSYFDISIVFLAGTVCLVALGLVFASRGTNEELTNGVINFLCWPMMFLSEVWFSIEGSSEWVKTAARALPLTHFLNAARKVINDGAGLAEVSAEITILAAMSLVFLTAGSLLFSWTR